MEFIDHIHTGSVTYTDRTSDIDRDTSRTIRISSNGTSTEIARVFLGDISNGKVVRIYTRGDTTYAAEGSLFVAADGTIEEVIPISGGATITPTIEGDYLVLSGPSAEWTSLVTVI